MNQAMDGKPSDERYAVASQVDSVRFDSPRTDAFQMTLIDLLR